MFVNMNALWENKGVDLEDVSHHEVRSKNLGLAFEFEPVFALGGLDYKEVYVSFVK